MTTSRAADGPMVQWLTSDLQANLQPWSACAFWHHPPYSKGSHDSDGEIEHIEMRANILPVLENYGVDLVLSGHSHNYERSWLLDGHYGHSTSLTSANKKGPGDGRENGDGPYYKTGAGMNPHQGAVYITAGSPGRQAAENWTTRHTISPWPGLGSLVVDVDGNRMDVQFLREASTPDAAPVFDDYFSLIKGVPPPPPGTCPWTLSAKTRSRVDDCPLAHRCPLHRPNPLWHRAWRAAANRLRGRSGLKGSQR